jgi:antitoxin (DNA-binding transcriptional repressor) of toxin-antitoxin stability system
MKTLELRRTSPSFRRAARLARGGVLVLTENGKPAFAIVGVKDQLALEALALSRNDEFMAYLDEVSRRAKRERTYSLKEMREEFGIPARRRNGRRKR